MTIYDNYIIIDGKMVSLSTTGETTTSEEETTTTTPTDKVIWGISWSTDDGTRVEWMFDGTADSFNVYRVGTTTNTLLVNTTESYYEYSSGDASDQYLVEAIQDGSAVDTVTVDIDTYLLDTNMRIYGTIVTMGGQPADGAEVFIYTESQINEFAHRTLMSKLRLIDITDDDGNFHFYVRRGLTVSLSIPFAFVRKTLTLPTNIPSLDIIEYADIGM